MKSPTAIDSGLLPVAGLAEAEVAMKVPSPLPRSTVIVLLPALATARSGMPSPLKSAVTIPIGSSPVGKLAAAAVNVPSPFPNSTVILLLSSLAIARSGMPSSLKSPTTIELPARLAGRLSASVNVPSPLPRSTAPFAVARSRMPSPLKSPVVMADGPSPGAPFCASTKLNPAVPAVSVAVPRTALALLASRKDTVPVGAALPNPDTVAVSV